MVTLELGLALAPNVREGAAHGHAPLIVALVAARALRRERHALEGLTVGPEARLVVRARVADAGSPSLDALAGYVLLPLRRARVVDALGERVALHRFLDARVVRLGR